MHVASTSPVLRPALFAHLPVRNVLELSATERVTQRAVASVSDSPAKVVVLVPLKISCWRLRLLRTEDVEATWG